MAERVKLVAKGMVTRTEWEEKNYFPFLLLLLFYLSNGSYFKG